jgi:hypothetical protein
VSAVPGERLSRVGWLLTPLVVWAASFFGAWLGAIVARRWITPMSDLAVMGLGAVGLSAVATAGWVALLRRVHRHGDPPTEAPGGRREDASL